VNCVRFCFLVVSVTFLFVYEISRESLKWYATNSHGRRVWSLARTSFKVKVKGHRSRSPRTKMGFTADISGTAERICAKFIRKTCLVSHSDEFEGQVTFGCLRAVYVWKNIFVLVKCTCSSWYCFQQVTSLFTWTQLMATTNRVKAKFHYAICFEAGRRQVRSRFEAGRRPAASW